MTKEEFDFIIKNQTPIDDKWCAKHVKKIIEDVAGNYMSRGFIEHNTKIVKIKSCRKNTEFHLYNSEGTCTHFLNLAKKHELIHVIGFKNNWLGVYENYLIKNFQKTKREFGQIYKINLL